MGFPEFDPHGDPIPNANGEIKKLQKKLLSEADLKLPCQCVGVKDTSTDFLQFLDKKNIALGTTITIVEKEPFDETLKIEINSKIITISNKIASNLYVQ